MRVEKTRNYAKNKVRFAKLRKNRVQIRKLCKHITKLAKLYKSMAKTQYFSKNRKCWYLN